ncbi:uncharacterized protein N7483_010893 [Penicillium malachiteum]|uniref:uncharacterized protein n=1 Tax=Penicillium malachiteum TaxID=1324776 RepID=UPI002547A3C9|nr:uncharacterized protein N7483_010893 [Penicillium malachiteum]KAJ5713712.1 hypothetical protein N7483_010893 [Penicillium malachiteum]
METWLRSADSFSSSKNRQIASATDQLKRSTNTLAQSADQANKLAIMASETSETKPTEDRKRSASTTTKTFETSQPLATQPSRNSYPYPQSRDSVGSKTFETPQPPATQSPRNSYPYPQSPDSVGSLSTLQSRTTSKSSSVSRLASLSRSEQSASSVDSPVSPPQKSAPSVSDISSTAPNKPPLDFDMKKKKKKVADQQVKELIELADKIDADLKQAKSLRDQKSAQLGDVEHNWSNTTMTDTEESLGEIQKILESYRAVLSVKKRKGKLNRSSRKRWRTQDCQIAGDKYPRLVLYQGRLEKVLGHLQKVAILKEPSPREEKQFPPLPVQTPMANPFAELSVDEEVQMKPFAELAVDDEVMTSLPTIVELPVDSTTLSSKKTFIAELPGNAFHIRRKPIQPVPKFYVTKRSHDLSAEQVERNDAGEESSHENRVMNESTEREKTKNDIQIQQTESLAQIVSEMENNRIQ